MKKSLILLVFMCLYKISFAQINVTYATANNNLLWQIIKKSNGNYLVVINGTDKTQLPIIDLTKIFEMNPQGLFIDSTILKKSNQDLFINRLIPISDGYIGLGQIKNKVDSHPFFWVIRMNKQLQPIQDTIISVARSIVAPSVAFDRDSNIIFVISELSRTNYFGKIDKRGFVKSWKIDTNALGISSNSLIIRKDSTLYTAFFDYRFVTFDTAFNKIHESKTVFNRTIIGLNSTITSLNDSVVSIAGKGVPNPTTLNGFRHFFGITTLSGREIFKNIYSTSNDTTIWGAWNYNSDTTKLGEWYWGGTHNYIYGASGRAFSQSSFLLHKLNKDYSTKWTKKYGGDAYYELYGVLATDDGGCLIYGTRYDYNNTPKYDAYILKVNADGLITSESSIPLSLNTVHIYPNPSNGFVHFDYKEPLKDIQIRVVDTKGSLVHQVKLSDGVLPTLDLSFLNNGVYFIQIMEQNQLFAVCRWVKGF